MRTSVNPFLLLAALSGFLAVAIGAFGAHILSSSLTEKRLDIYHTAVDYQFYHTLALLVVGIFVQLYRNEQRKKLHKNAHLSIPEQQAIVNDYNVKMKGLYLSGWSFVIGILLFSGSLYALVLTDVKALGAITPVGGILFMLGWLSLAFHVIRQR